MPRTITELILEGEFRSRVRDRRRAFLDLCDIEYAVKEHKNRLKPKPQKLAVFVLVKNDLMLMEYRPDMPFDGKLSFPGGKVEKGESVGQALHREIREELRITAFFVSAMNHMDSFVYNGYEIHPFMITSWAGSIPTRTDAGHQLTWLPTAMGAQVTQWPPAQKIAEFIKEHYS